MKVKNWLIILFIIFVFLGYAQAKDLTNKETQTKKTNRKIERKDAVGIAREFLKEKDLQADYYLTKYIAKLKDGVWHVVFLKKGKERYSNKAKSIKIKIDQTTGQIIEQIEQDGFFIDKSQR